MSYEVEREKRAHGESWAKQASGYFANPRIARDYVAAIMRVARNSKPSAIVDLGGGTGFILCELIKAGIDNKVKLVAFDESETQLAVCADPRIVAMKGDMLSFYRSSIVGEGENLMLICRSVLHYAGFKGQRPWLSRLRSQLKEGEWFVHQSGCSEDAGTSAALNFLFEQMGIDKWVPHKEEFVRLITGAGFEITGDFAVSPVGMVSDELAVRYGVPPKKIASVGAELKLKCKGRPDLLKTTPAGFVFNFPYRVFMCRAV